MRAASCLVFLGVALAGGRPVAVARAGDRAEPRPASLSALVAATPPGGVLALPEGTFDGGMTVTGDLTIRGAGAGRTRVRGTGGDGLRVAGGVVRIEALSLESGAAGLVVGEGARVHLQDVRIAGAEVALRVESGARAVVDGLEVRCAKEAATGVLARRASLDARRLVMRGGCRCGLDVAEGVADVADSVLVGARETGIRVVDGALALADTRVETAAASHSASSLFAARSLVRVERVTFSGGEYGLLARSGRITGGPLSIRDARTAGLAANGAVVSLDGLSLTGPFSTAAVLASERSLLELRDVVVEHAGAVGVLAVRARIVLERARISGASTDKTGDFGHAVVLNHSLARIEGLDASQLQGAAIYASESNATVVGAAADRAAAGLAASLGANLVVTDLRVGPSCGAGVVAWQRSVVRVSGGVIASRIAGVSCFGSRIALGGGIRVTSKERERSCLDQDLSGNLSQFLSPAAP